MRVDVKHDLRADLTAAFAIVAEGWNEFVQEGHSPEGIGTPPYQADSQVLYAVSPDGDIVGVLVYALLANTDRIRLQLAYVEHSSRRLGVFKALFAQLQSIAYQRAALNIDVEVPVTCLVFSAVLAKLGCRSASIVFQKKVG